MAEEKNKRKKKRKEALRRATGLADPSKQPRPQQTQNNINNDHSSTANTAARARPPGVITDSVRASPTSRRGPQWTRPMTAMPGPEGAEHIPVMGAPDTC